MKDIIRSLKRRKRDLQNYKLNSLKAALTKLVRSSWKFTNVELIT